MPLNSSHSLLSLNTLGLAQSCAELHPVHSTAELTATCLSLLERGLPFLILGGGSNLVFTEDFDGAVVQVLSKGIEVTQDAEHYFLRVQAGESWHELVSYSLQQGIAGLENLALIPGTVGAAPIQNIGAYGLELCDICDWVEYLDFSDGQIKRLTADDCEFGYRDSVFKGRLRDKAAITSVGLRLSKDWQPRLSYGPLQEFDCERVTPQQIFERVCEVRREKLPDPAALGNVGSFFKNPIISAATYHALAQTHCRIVAYAQDDGRVKLAAGWLIEAAGLKGYRRGAAAVHDKQALVLVNLGGANGNDICQLALDVIARVRTEFGLLLEPEPRIMGRHGERMLTHVG
ncbi:UDP-N-acetylmuramate dehydrogenase [Shewanella salipaludis]|uniref:UDP-N-acetylenolpyruvoylglucosamine reductase n=1 Tax=Shewanella salipaludis TaxID=2723052 RepID=A0A972JMB0_9GAMM|nr:UDP-N-acetylmuramate dehydrogenase [Shewanella salipaludis]NMH67074.1 UDP-N-acetylmuramate dehydrogenase [Shewanella salipaludis]